MDKKIYYILQDGSILCFKVHELYFRNLEEAQKFIRINKYSSYEDIVMSFVLLGTPLFVNIDKSIEANKIIYYKTDELTADCWLE